MTDDSAANESGSAAQSASASFNADGTPQQIDRYRILHEIGSGGMATVYAALQPHPRRTVALKVLKTDAANHRSVRRFRREAEILARLRHPSIAQVYDAGTYEHGGRTWPYFVMEFIPGAKTILEYVAQKQLNRRDRLKLFVSVCRAVEYGHQHRVLHRDLKPGNILIDQSGRLKIIDFGVASAPDLRVKGTTMDTEAGRLVGTIQYMSPEQVASNPQDLDRRSDVYALGVLLYKLMTGSFPHNVDGQPVYEAVRMIREDEPVRPGKRSAELRGDLETIILRAIARNRSHRYRSAGELAADVVRYLNRQPIKARSAGRLYRLRLFLQRHRAAAMLGATMFIVVASAAGVTAWALLKSDARESAAAGAAQPSAASGSAEGARPGMPASAPLKRQNGRVLSVAFDPTGRYMISGATDRTIVVWNVPTFEVAEELKLPEQPAHQETGSVTLQAELDDRRGVRTSRFSADGALLATISDDSTVTVWRCDSMAKLNSFEGPGGMVHDLALTDDAAAIALACDDLTLRQVEIALMKTMTLRSATGQFLSTAYSGDGTRIIGGTERGDVYVWDAHSGEQLTRWSAFESPVALVTFDPTGAFVITVASNGAGAVWNLDALLQGEQTATAHFNACSDDVAAAHVTTTRQWLAVASTHSARLWDLRAVASTGSIRQHGRSLNIDQRVHSIAVDENAQRLAVGSSLGEIRLFNVEQARPGP